MSSGHSWMLGYRDQALKQDALKKQLRAKHLQIMKAKTRFAELFGANVETFYKDIYLGFDIVAFDDYLMTKDEQYRKANAGELGEEVDCSMETHIKAKYGEEAMKMIQVFI